MPAAIDRTTARRTRTADRTTLKPVDAALYLVRSRGWELLGPVCQQRSIALFGPCGTGDRTLALIDEMLVEAALARSKYRTPAARAGRQPRRSRSAAGA